MRRILLGSFETTDDDDEASLTLSKGRDFFHPRSLYEIHFFAYTSEARERRGYTYVHTRASTDVYMYRVLGITCIEQRCGDRGPEEKGIDFSAGLCEMKPGRAIAINNDKNNPIRRLFDLSAPIFRARSIRLITILLDLGGAARRAEPSRTSRSEQSRGRRAREIEFIESCSTNYVRR